MNPALNLSQGVAQVRSSEALLLAAGLAHDFNNILNVIDGYLQLIQENPDSSDLVAKYLMKARKAVEGGSFLTSNLLTAGSAHQQTLCVNREHEHAR